MGYNIVVNINGARLQKDLAGKAKESFSKISTFILNNSESYLSQACSKNAIGVTQLNKLCNFYGLDKDDYIIEEEKQEQAPLQDNAKIYADIYNLLNKIYAENRDLNSRLDRYEKMLQTITSNSTKGTEKLCSIFTEIKYNLEK